MFSKFKQRENISLRADKFSGPSFFHLSGCFTIQISSNSTEIVILTKLAQKELRKFATPEWKIDNSSQKPNCASDRCIPGGMGMSLSGKKDRGPIGHSGELHVQELLAVKYAVLSVSQVKRVHSFHIQVDNVFSDDKNSKGHYGVICLPIRSRLLRNICQGYWTW